MANASRDGQERVISGKYEYEHEASIFEQFDQNSDNVSTSLPIYYTATEQVLPLISRSNLSDQISLRDRVAFIDTNLLDLAGYWGRDNRLHLVRQKHKDISKDAVRLYRGYS